jgi:hypothetical protein
MQRSAALPAEWALAGTVARAAFQAMLHAVLGYLVGCACVYQLELRSFLQHSSAQSRELSASRIVHAVRWSCTASYSAQRKCNGCWHSKSASCIYTAVMYNMGTACQELLWFMVGCRSCSAVQLC